MAKEKKGASIEPLDKSAIADARKRAEAKAQELLRAELDSLIQPRTEEIERLKKRRDALATEADEITADINRLADEVDEIVGEPRRKAGRASSGAGGKRERRSKEELEGDCGGILNMVKAAGKSGVSAQSIKAKYPKCGASIAAFVEKYGGGVKLRREGSKREGVYFLA